MKTGEEKPVSGKEGGVEFLVGRRRCGTNLQLRDCPGLKFWMDTSQGSGFGAT